MALYFIQHRKITGEDVNIKLNTNILQLGTDQREPKFISMNCLLIQKQLEGVDMQSTGDGFKGRQSIPIKKYNVNRALHRYLFLVLQSNWVFSLLSQKPQML